MHNTNTYIYSFLKILITISALSNLLDTNKKSFIKFQYFKNTQEIFIRANKFLCLYSLLCFNR